MGKIVIAYVPVLHEGYYSFFTKHKDAKAAYVFDKSLIKKFDWLRKELRALDPELVVSAIRSWKIIPDTSLISLGQLSNVGKSDQIIMPDEDISHDLAHEFFSDQDVVFDPIFLRWDRRRSNAKDEANPDHAMSESDFDKQMVILAHKESKQSSNIWRQVGALILKDGKILNQASNRHQPTDHTAWIDGDIRMNFFRGVGIEMSTDMHAEAILIADAAKKGESLEEADIYMTNFPCPPCAMLIANSGIKRCFYAQGYAVLDGERVLKANDVELIKVNVELPPDRADVYRPYPEKAT